MIPDATARRTLRSFVISAIVAWLAFTVKHVIVGGRPIVVASNFTNVAILAGLLLVLHWRPSAWPIVLHGLAAVCTTGLMVSGWITGGPEALTWWYLTLVPLLVIHVGGRRAGLFWWLAACVAAVVAIWNPWNLPPEFIPNDADRAFGALALCTTATALAWLSRRAVEERVDEISGAARAKSELLATISHELRTPLHGILGVTSVLGETELSTEQRQLVDALERSGTTLKRTVDDVLDDARLAAGKLTIEPAPVDLLATLEDVVDLHAADAGRKGLTLTLVLSRATEAALCVVADETRVRQILSNLVANAIEFTAEGSVMLTVSCRVVATRSELELAVEDTGPGIAPERMPRLFTPFDRLDPTLSHVHGTGLGLVLARELAHRMGGTLEAERGRPLGARFVVRLGFPLADVPETARRGVILLLEPKPAYAEAARSLGRTLAGLELIVATGLDEAEAVARARPIDGVVVSIDPSIDHVSAHQRLQSATAPRTHLVLAVPADRDGVRASSAPFETTTLRPLRRSRLGAVLEGARVRPSRARLSTAKHALIVDDDPTNRRILAAFFAQLGWSTVVHASGAGALDALLVRPFDVCVCDLQMPEMDGVAFVTQARRRGSTGLFVAATASVREEDRARCLAAGFDAFLRKPFDATDVVSVIERRGSTRDLPKDPAVIADEALLDERKWEAAQQLLGSEIADALADHETATGAQIETMRRSSSDARVVARAAHAISSGSTMLGMRAVGEAASALELGVAALDERTRTARIDELDTLLARSMARLRASASTPF